MKNQKSVFTACDEFVCTQFYDVDSNQSGVDISRDDVHLGEILGLSIPDIDDEEENINFDKKVIDWIEENNF